MSIKFAGQSIRNEKFGKINLGINYIKQRPERVPRSRKRSVLKGKQTPGLLSWDGRDLEEIPMMNADPKMNTVPTMSFELADG